MKRVGIILSLVFFLISCQSHSERLFRKSEILMDTIVTITVVSDSEKKAEVAIDRAFRELKRLDRLFNAFSPQSEVSDINRNAGKKKVKTAEDTVRLIGYALKIGELTDGAFDITVGAVTRLYDFHSKVVPSMRQIRETLRYVDFRKVVIEGDRVYLPEKGMRIDPGGIAKGYAADRAIEILKTEGIKGALVAVAGDIKGYGRKPDGSPWRVGIRDPRGGREDIFAVVELRDEMAISTSGDYERYFIKDGKRYHHIIDPNTGLPAEGLISVSVIGKEGTYTDSLATAVFIMGGEEGRKVAEELGYGVVMVDRKGNISMSESIKGLVNITKSLNRD